MRGSGSNSSGSLGYPPEYSRSTLGKCRRRVRRGRQNRLSAELATPSNTPPALCGKVKMFVKAHLCTELCNAVPYATHLLDKIKFGLIFICGINF